jgi:hypothetical protein
MVAVKKESVDSRRLKVTDRFFMRGVRVRGSLFFNSHGTAGSSVVTSVLLHAGEAWNKNYCLLALSTRLASTNCTVVSSSTRA